MKKNMNNAVVDNEENADFQSFQETAAINNGLFLKRFSDSVAARSWLKSRHIEDDKAAEERGQE